MRAGVAWLLGAVGLCVAGTAAGQADTTGTPEQERARTIEVRLEGDPGLGDDDIGVEVSGKRVRLVGAVDSAAERRHADEIVRQIDPTLTVENLLRVEDSK